MKTLNFSTLLIVSFGLILTAVNLQGQSKYSVKDEINMTISGTSTMHDWEMKSHKGDCKATFSLDANGQVTGITEIKLSIPAKSLTSGKGTMDKNAYKALKVDQFPNITATLKSCEISTKDNKTFTSKSVIKLFIAGKMLETELITLVKKINDTSFSVKGEKKISMKDYGMEPPSFMLGAVKTGNDVVVNFDLILNQ